LKILFQPDKMNYAALSNTSPKIHVHIVPRYSDSRGFGGVIFQDTRWGKNYAPYDKAFKIEEETLFKVRDALKEAMKQTIFLLVPLLIAFTFPIFAAPRAIVFDFGGVMTVEANHSSRVFNAAADFIKESFHLSESEFAKMNHQRLLALQQGGSDEKFLAAFAKEKEIHLPDDWFESFKTIMRNAVGIDIEMYKLVNQLKQHIRVGLLSNSDGHFTNLLRDCGIYEPFDPCLLSSEIGALKPNLKAYKLLLSELSLPPKEVIFIDDKLENVEAAKDLGLDGILFESAQQIKRELIKRQVLSLAVQQ
jgi:epoxide hydrolase-like predicted phosphatase